MAFRTVALAALVASVELTKENWDEMTDGKTIFVKFFAPWCGHCKSMKPDWDKLMAEYEGSATALVADVDCTADGKAICDEIGVEGFPTLKWGEPSALEDYEGGRDLDSLKTFAAKSLKPMCSVKNIDLCDDEKKAQIEELQAMSADDLKKSVDDKEKEIATLESEFKTFVEGLQSQYEEGSKKKDDGIAEIKSSGLGLMKAVLAAQASGTNEEL